MRMLPKMFVLWHLAAVVVAAQAARPVFDTASVKRSLSDALAGENDRQAGRFSQMDVTLRDLIESAYRRREFDRYEIVGAPDWIDSDRFDVVATMKPGADPIALYLPDGKGSPGNAYLMLRTLLEDRFKLTLHIEQRETSVFVMALAGTKGRLGRHLARSRVSCQAWIAKSAEAMKKRKGQLPRQPQGRRAPCSIGVLAPGRLEGAAIDMATMADALAMPATTMNAVGRPIVDKTGLTGDFDFTLEWAPDDHPETVPRGAIFTAIEEQLGLKLQPAQEPVDVLVIDHVDHPRPD